MTGTTMTKPRPDQGRAQPPAIGGSGSAWMIVTRREVMAKVTNRTFLLGTLFSLVLIGVMLGLQIFLGTRTHDYTVVATPAAVPMAEEVRDRAPGLDEGVVVEVERVPDDAAARAAVSDESADAWLHQQDGTWMLTTKSEPEQALESVTENVVRDVTLRANAESAGTSAETLQRGTALATALLEGDAQRAQLVGILTYVFSLLTYFSMFAFGITLAYSVVEEKQSRIAEIIAARIPVRHLLAGKLIGNTLLAVVQLALYVTVGMIGLAFTDFSGLVAGVAGSVAWFLVFFLAGFVALSCLWAVAGSLASRVEDVGSTSTPLSMLMMGMFFAGFLLDGTAQTVGSFVPPLSALLMPIRLLQGSATWWEAVLALALLMAAAAGTIVVGERIYRRSLLQTGGRVSLRQAWKAQD